MLSQLGRLRDAVLAVVNPAAAAKSLRDRIRYEQLATYDAARRDRTTRDWRTRRGSADAAIIPDADILRDRARSLRRDNWMGDSIVETYGRNVVGRGIMPVATAKSDDGTELQEFNERIDTLFIRWADAKRYVDVCRKQSLWAKQRMAMEETVESGEHFWIWSYSFDPNGVVPGLKLQSFEPEQLDIERLRNEETGFEVRKGIEVDGFGGPVAFWFYDQPLNDLYGGVGMKSSRYPADRVFHFMRQKRVRQTHGVTRLTPSMNRIRNVDSYDEATLLSAKTEAFPALEINREGGGGGIDSLVAGQDGAGGQGGDGCGYDRDGDHDIDDRDDERRRMAMEPAMVFEGRPGETIKVVQKQNGGANYTPYMNTNVGAAAAGSGLSRSVVAHDYTQGTYSGERQAALQDNREYGCWQDALIDDLQILWELFVKFAILEDEATGRYGLGITVAEFSADPHGYSECEWVPDGIGWVDPAKEAAADSIALDKRLNTRKDIIARKFGKNWRRVFQQLRDEEKFAEQIGLTLPDVEPAPPSNIGDAPPGQAPAQTDPHGSDEPAEPPSPPQKAEAKHRRRRRRSYASTDGLINAILIEAVRAAA